MSDPRGRHRVRAALLAAGIGLGCGDFPEPPWVLREEPEVLAFRLDIVEPGPHSGVGLLPIPADRVRSEPLPLDTVEVSGLIASNAGRVPMAELDPVWMLCPSGSCISTLGDAGALEPCGDTLPERVACRLPEGDSTRFVVPTLDPNRPLVEQARFRVAMVGHTRDDVTTDDCIRRIADPDRPRWDGCLVGYINAGFGPITQAYLVAQTLGVELPELDFDPSELSTPVAPHYNPEIVPLQMTPIYAGPQVDNTRNFFATPGKVTTLVSGSTYVFLEEFDGRDQQEALVVRDEGVVRLSTIPVFLPHCDTPNILEFGPGGRWVVRAPEAGATFSLVIALTDPLGGAAWDVFEFEVVDP